MGRRYIIGKEYLLISRKEYGQVPTAVSYPSEKEATAALRKAQAENEELILKIESRTLFNTDTIRVADPDRKITSREVSPEPSTV